MFSDTKHLILKFADTKIPTIKNGFSVERLRIKCFLFTTQYLSFPAKVFRARPTVAKSEKKAPEVFRNLFSTVKSNRKSIQRRTKGTSSSRNDAARDYLRPHNYPFFPTYSGARLPSPIQWYVALGNDKLILVGWSGGRLTGGGMGTVRKYSTHLRASTSTGAASATVRCRGSVVRPPFYWRGFMRAPSDKPLLCST